jgi:hypothetical protein
VVQCAHLEKWWSLSMGRMTSHILIMENKIHVWNHQPGMDLLPKLSFNPFLLGFWWAHLYGSATADGWYVGTGMELKNIGKSNQHNVETPKTANSCWVCFSYYTILTSIYIYTIYIYYIYICTYTIYIYIYYIYILFPSVN